MSKNIMKNIVGLITGTFFGFWLCWTNFTHYDTIFGALVFKDLYLWFMFATALGTSALGLQFLKRSGAVTWLDRNEISWERITPSRDIVMGSCLFGLGWAIAGTCPGPAAAQVGQGHLSGIFTLLGVMLGIALCDELEDRASGRSE